MIRSSIDIGTNSVRLLVADLSVHPPAVIESALKITRLGEKLDETGVIRLEAAARTAAAVRSFAERARAHGGPITIFATAAMREARNGAEIAADFEAVCGEKVRVVPGEDEALITFRGVEVGHRLGPGAMVLDIGGGSTEFTTRGEERPVSQSLSLGSVRQTERHLRGDPPSDSEVDALVNDVRALVAQGIDGRRAERLYGVAGSVTQMVAIELELEPYDSRRVDGYRMSLAVVEKWTDRLRGMKQAERRKLKGMVPERAATVFTGAVILRETIAALGLAEVTVSEYDSLWGALTMWESNPG